jgi:predicted hotdog family 3-hydroxylacyl-ACP dehydratase
MRLNRPLEELLPHAGRMRLIDRVVEYDAVRIVCEANSHRATDHPLAIDGVLSAVCGLEYGAQAMAIHGALVSGGERPRVGFLVAARELAWSASRLDTVEAPMTIEAQREFGSDNQVSYAFSLRAAGHEVMRGRASVVLRAP